jgi:hypothetical protein
MSRLRFRGNVFAAGVSAGRRLFWLRSEPHGELPDRLSGLSQIARVVGIGWVMVAKRRLCEASDGELLALTAREPEAFGVFYDRFEAAVLAFFYRATGRADVAADLTAEVFAAALQSADAVRFRSGGVGGAVRLA